MSHTHSRPFNYYLRSHRRHAHLTQAELAYLLGEHTGTNVSLYETGARKPSLDKGLAYEAALGEPVAKLFRGRYEEIRDLVEERRRKLMADRERRQAKVSSVVHSAA